MSSRQRGSWYLVALAVVAVAIAVAAVLDLGPPSSSARTSREIVTAQKGVVQSTVTGSGNVEPGTEAFLIMRGCVKILADSADGRLVLLSVRMPGELIGELAPLDGQARSATGRAAGPVVTRAIGASALNEYLAAHPAADLAVRNRIVARLREATQKRIQVNNAAPVPRRLAWALCLLGERYGVPVAGGVLIDAPLSQADIASLI